MKVRRNESNQLPRVDEVVFLQVEAATVYFIFYCTKMLYHPILNSQDWPVSPLRGGVLCRIWRAIQRHRERERLTSDGRSEDDAWWGAWTTTLEDSVLQKHAHPHTTSPAWPPLSPLFLRCAFSCCSLRVVRTGLTESLLICASPYRVRLYQTKALQCRHYSMYLYVHLNVYLRHNMYFCLRIF